MIELIKELDSKTVTLALVLAVGLCWPALYVTQIEPRNDKIDELKDELSEIQSEIKALKLQSKEVLRPYQDQLRLLTENKALIEIKNSVIEKQLNQYRNAYEDAVKKNSQLRESRPIDRIKKLTRKKGQA